MTWLQAHWHHITGSVTAALAFIYRADLLAIKIYRIIKHSPNTLSTSTTTQESHTMPDTVAQAIQFVEADITAAAAALPAVETAISVLAPMASLIPGLKPYAANAQLLVKGLSAITADLPDAVAKVQAAELACAKVVADFEAAIGVTTSA